MFTLNRSHEKKKTKGSHDRSNKSDPLVTVRKHGQLEAHGIHVIDQQLLSIISKPSLLSYDPFNHYPKHS
jgi:hypothetical protein